MKFYSEYDMLCGLELNKAIKIITNESIDNEWSINDLIEFHNILKYIQIKRFKEIIQEKTGIVCDDYSKKIQRKIGQYLNLNKDNIIEKYDEIDYGDAEDYLEIVEQYSIYKNISEAKFKSFLKRKDVDLYLVLKFKKIVDHFDNIIKEELLSDVNNAELIIAKYADDSKLYLPKLLLEDDQLQLIDSYIDLENVNINVLREIIHFPKNKGFSIKDKVKLHATRKEKELTKSFFNGDNNKIETGVKIAYKKGIDKPILINSNDRTVNVVINQNWIENNMDYPTLWNNFIYLFEVIDTNARSTVVSKTNDMSAIESSISPSRKYLYKTSVSFDFREMNLKLQVYSYIQMLNVLNVRIEDMIEWFFNDYMCSEFSVNDFIVKMPTQTSSYFEKCRTILPEIDRIFKQFNSLIEDGEIDQELIQLSSSSVKFKDVKSFMPRKYVYPNSEWYNIASYFLFSDQSSIFYLSQKNLKFKNFFDLIIHEDISKNEFQDYQLRKMSWLFENNLVIENEKGYIKFANSKIVFILKELYYEDVLNYWHYSKELRNTIDDMEFKKYVIFESSLLTKNEQDYLDYYLNKAKFTNGYDLRNSYLHGTNVNNEKQHEEDYFSILKLFIIIILKINDELCLKEDINS